MLLADIHEKINIRSQRITKLTLDVIFEAIPDEWKKRIDSHLQSDENYISNPVNYTFELHHSDELNYPLYKLQKGVIYKYLVLVLHANRLPGKCDSVWRDILSLPNNIKPNFKACYLPLLSSREGDIQWRLAHGIFMTGSIQAKMGFSNTETCTFCDEKDTLFHTFYECTENVPLLQYISLLAKRLLQNTTIDIPPHWFVLNPPNKSKKFYPKQSFHIFVTLCSIAKTSIYLSRRNKRQNNSFPIDPLHIFKNRLKLRLQTDFSFFKLNHQLQLFNNIWAINNALCYVNHLEELVITE